jgi:hypothetical protein
MLPEPDDGGNNHIERKGKEQTSGYTAGSAFRGLRKCLPAAQFNR